jgi:hypothetical protein
MCLLAVVALVSPRLALAGWWLIGDKVDLAFGSSLWPLLGLIFAPWTTLAYVAAWQPGGLSGNADAVLVLLGIAADVVSYMHRFAARTVR